MTDPKIDHAKTMVPVTLTLDDWRKVGAALEELPVKVAMPVIANIQAQIVAFFNPPAPVAPPPAPPAAPAIE